MRRAGAVLGIGLLLRGSRARRMLKPPALGGWSAVDVHCVSNKCCVPLRRGVADEMRATRPMRLADGDGGLSAQSACFLVLPLGG